MNRRSKTIMIVDDKQCNISLFEAILRTEGYSTFALSSGDAALAAVTEQPPDLILLDVMMPGLDGYQVASKIKRDPLTSNIPIIMVTALGDQNSKLNGLNASVEEFLIKPVDATELRLRVRNMLRNKEYADLLNHHNRVLEKRIRARALDLHTSHVETIFALTRAAEHRDDDTGAHVRRISSYALHLAEILGMDDEFCDMICHASPMHDIGKIGIPDSILLKPSAHTPDESKIMKSHCTLGADILLGCDSPYLKMGAEIALNHHERWDGSGYPSGLSGNSIPLAARIMGVCDVYDALRAKRPYKAPFTHERAMRIIVDGDGRTLPQHFAPDVLEAFKKCAGHFEEIYDECNQ